MNDAHDFSLTREFLTKSVLQQPFAWAVYRLVTDDSGRPLDAVLLEANESFASLLGIPLENLRALTLREAMADDPSGADRRLDLYGRVTHDRSPAVFEEYLKKPDRWIRVTVTSPEFLHFVTVALDISDVKRLEQRQGELETRLRVIIENAPCGILVADGQGRYVDVNGAACELIGYTREELLSRSIPDVVPPDRMDISFGNFESLKIEGNISLETQMSRKDGAVADVSLDAVALGDGTFLAYCSDLGDRKRLELARDRYLSAFLAVDRAIFLLDAEGSMLEANDRFFDMYGYARDGVQKPGTVFLDPGLEIFRRLGYADNEYVELFLALWRDVRNPSVRAWDGVLPNVRKDGTVMWNHLVLRGVFTVSGRLDSIVGFPTEIKPPLPVSAAM